MLGAVNRSEMGGRLEALIGLPLNTTLPTNDCGGTSLNQVARGSRNDGRKWLRSVCEDR